ncbi:MAG: DUF190 domain-containing protein [Acidimicrobiales bacterium]
MRPAAASRFPTHAAKRVTISLTVRDHIRHGSLMVHLLKCVRRAKLAGATVFEALEGYGASGRIHRNHPLSEDAPLTVVIIDRPERVDSLLRDLAGSLDDVLVVVDEIEVVELPALPTRGRRR